MRAKAVMKRDMALCKLVSSEAVPLQVHSSPAKHMNGDTMDTSPRKDPVSQESSEARADINVSAASPLVAVAEIPDSLKKEISPTHDTGEDNGDKDDGKKDDEDNKDDSGIPTDNAATTDRTAVNAIVMHDTYGQFDSQLVKETSRSQNVTADDNAATQIDQSVVPQPTGEMLSAIHADSQPMNGNENDDTQMVFGDDDVGSLLPGLEMYANDPISTNFDDLNSLSLKNENNLGDISGISADQNNGNNFDDLFNLGEYGGDGGDIGEFPNGTGNFDTQFDENFFNLG